MKTKNWWSKGAIFLVSGILIGYSSVGFMAMRADDMENMDMDEMRGEFVEEKEMMQMVMRADGDYACCLEKACTYCIEKTPGHGEGATCSCLEDVVEGRHPCGECIGEIMEGHGNKFLAKYFAKAIAEEMGEEYITTLRQMMTDKYDISIEEQI